MSLLQVYCGAISAASGLFDHVPTDIITKSEAMAGFMKAFESFCDSKNVDVRAKAK